MPDDIFTSFRLLTPWVQAAVLLAFVGCVALVLFNYLAAAALITALGSSAAFIQSKRNSRLLNAITNRLDRLTPPHDKTFNPVELFKAAKNGEGSGSGGTRETDVAGTTP